MRVMESSRTTTSLPDLDQALDAVEHELGDLDVVLAGLVEGAGTTSPLTERCMSVTSSGRSSTSSTKRSTSGLLAAIELASFLRIVVLPAFGGETMRPRWPLPMGHSRSMMRAAVSCSSVSRRRRSSGNSGVSYSKTGR